MQKQEHKVHENERVRLKSSGEDALYAFACAGSEGWVRKLDHDSMGYPMVFIEWDKDHWTYNGEPDKWAFEAHFDKIKEPNKMAETPTPNPQDFAQFMAAWQAWQASQQSGDQETPQLPQATDSPKINKDEAYKVIAGRAIETLEEADSFILVTVNRESHEASDTPVLIPRVFNFYKSTEGGLLVEMQLTKLGAIAHEELSVEAIRQVLGEPDES
jgi:hypothetical protein